jgi:hypothetical protein
MSDISLIQVPPEALQPLIDLAVERGLARLEEVRAQLDGKLAFSEEEAARLLSLEVHQLRDERRRGRIRAFTVVGGRVRYTRQDLLDYLMARPWSEETARESGWKRGRRRGAKAPVSEQKALGDSNGGEKGGRR